MELASIGDDDLKTLLAQTEQQAPPAAIRPGSDELPRGRVGLDGRALDAASRRFLAAEFGGATHGTAGAAVRGARIAPRCADASTTSAREMPLAMQGLARGQGTA